MGYANVCFVRSRHDVRVTSAHALMSAAAAAVYLHDKTHI